MIGYADTSFLVSLYLPDANSIQAQAATLSFGSALPFSALHALEARNAIQLNVFRGQLTVAQAAQIWETIVSDVRVAKLLPVSINWALALRYARKDAGAHTTQIGLRSLDVLHIACARVVGARDFFSFDTKQRRVASALRFNVLP
jgi:predicted nucleic acid-binding protein